MSRNINKHIDFNQFPMDNNGHIIWNKSVGLTVDFYYYDERHTIKILGYGKPNKDHIEIKVDDMPSEVVMTQKIRNLSFDDLFGKPNYLYEVGDIVNGSVILEQLHIKKRDSDSYKAKYYKCKCLVDGYEYVVKETELKRGSKCPVCSGKRVFVGYNDLATTNPDIVKFLSDKDDGYRYTRGSSKRIQVICPICGYKKYMKIEDLVYNGGLSCPRCSDGLSYPNKFAFNVFEQLNEQYEEYQSEYSPDWLGQMRYDNYIVLKDGSEIIVEMDGGFHQNEYGKRAAKTDVIKDTLAEQHGIKIIRVDCFYNRITERFEVVKNGLVNVLKEYFDLSYVDWDYANEVGISNRLVEAVNYYKEHPFMTNQQIADHFRINVVTVRHYLTVGEKLGLCTYIRHDPNRWKTSIPLALYDSNYNLIDVFISARHMEEVMADKGFRRGSIAECAKIGRPYKGYVIEQITWEEFEQYQNIA